MTMRRAAAPAVLLLAAMTPRAAAAQGDCFPPKDSHEAKTLAVASVPLAFSPLSAPFRVPHTTFRLGVEGATVPTPDETTRTATICRPGKGPEKTQFLFAIPRPRAELLLPWGMGLEVSWIPPVRLAGVRANLVSVALGYRAGIGKAALGLRAHGTVGLIRAPITCDTDALADPASECFEGTRSDDRYHPNIFGLDASVGVPVAGGRLRPYAGVGYNILHPRFQVNFTNSQGSTDNRKIEVDLARFVTYAGASWVVRPAWEVSAELYLSPSDALSGRMAVRRGFGS